MPNEINPFDTAADQVVNAQATTIRQNITQNVGGNADQAAQYQHLAKYVGVPTDTVYAEPEAIKQQAAVKKLDAPKMVSEYPHLAQFMSGADNAAKSHDDVAPLAATETAVKNLPAPHPASAPPETSGWLAKNAASVNETPMALMQGFAGSFNDAMKAVNIIGGSVPTVYDDAVSLITGKPYSSASDWWFQNAVSPLVENEGAFQLKPNATALEKTVHGIGGLVGMISQIISTGGVGEVTAAPGTAMEAVPALSTTLPAAAEHATKSMALPAVTGAVNSGQQVYEATGDSAAAIQSALATYATTTATGFLPVALEGNLATRLASGIPAGALVGELNRQATNAANPEGMQTPFSIENTLVNAITGSILAGAMGSSARPQYESVMREQYHEGKQAIDVVQAGESIQAIGEVALQSKLRTRDPQAFSDYVKSMTDDGHTPELYINAETLNETLKQSGVPPEKFAEQLPDVARQLQEATATQSDVKISTADYATHIAGGPLDEVLRQHLKIDPAGKTLAEGQEYLDNLKEHTEEIAKSALKDQPAIDERKQQLQTIHDEHLAELEGTGRFPSDVNKQYAALRTSLIDRMADREGMSVTDVHKMLPLKVTAETQARSRELLDQGAMVNPDASLWHAVSQHDESFQLPKSKATTIEGVFKAQEGDKGIQISRAPHFDDAGAKVWKINPDKSTMGLMFEKGNEVWIDVADFAQGSAGKRVYNAVATYAHNTGKVFVGDPAGLSNVAKSRRLENMLSSALKFGTTKHLAPHPKQLAEGNGVKALKWKAGDDMHNIAEMIKASYETVLKQFPEVKNMDYNFSTHEFYDVNTKEVWTGEDFDRLADSKRDDLKAKAASEGRNAARQGVPEPITAGRTTLERAVLTDSFSRKSREEQSKILADISGKLPESLENLLYQGERGFYNPKTNTMGLLKDADLSTYLHETGHYWLESLHTFAQHPDASAEIKQDFDTLLQWFKVPGETPEARLADWNSRSTSTRREGHEKFAEGFERYLMDGKAPTPELQNLFGRFRAWLIRVYEGIRAPGEVLSPEVKSVMDRMFASEEAITEAERQRSYFPADFQDANPELLKQYNDLGREATDQAVADMQARTLRDMKWLSNAKSKAMKSLQREAKALRTEIRDEVTKQVMSKPVNQAHTALKDAGLKPSGNSLAVDLIAEQHGFANGKALSEAIRKEDVKAEIEGMTEQRMLERHGDLVDPVSIQRAAEAAIANDARAKQMATGLKILTKSPVPVSKIQKAAREAAELNIAGKLIEDLRPAIYSAAEARTNKELLKLAPKDPVGAAKAQRAALLNNRLFRASTDAVNDVRAGLTYFKKFSRDNIRAKIDVDIRDQIDDLLARFDLRVSPNSNPTRKQVNLEKWIESQMEAGMEPSVTEAMRDPTNKKPYRKMTVEEFRGLVDTIKSMEHIGRERETLMIQGEKFVLAEYIQDELVPRMQERGDNFTAEELYTRPEDRGISELKQGLLKFSSWIRAAGAQLKGQEFKRNEYDLHEILGPFGKSMFEPVMQANYRKVDMLKGLSDDFRTKATELGKDWQDSLTEMLDNQTLLDAIATKEAGQPVAFKMSRGKMVGMAVHVGNESNFDKLTKGYGWKPADVWKFLNENMTAKDWDAVQTIWDLYEKHWPEQVAMHRRLGQTIPEKIEPRPFKTPFGEMRGGYASIKYDPLRSRRGEKDAQGVAIDPNAGLFGRDYFSRSSTTNGAMKARSDSYTDAIDLNFHTIERAMHESIHDLAYRETLINTNKILEHSTFRKQFLKTYGRENYTALQDWIGRLANSENTDRNVGALGRFLQYTRTGMVMNAIALRASTVAKHGGSAGIKTMGYFAGGGEKFLTSRLASMSYDYRNQISSAIEKFPEIRARLLQQDRDYRATASSLFESESLQSKAERFGHSAVAWADMMTAVPTAWAAYDRAVTVGIPENQGGTGKPMTDAEATMYASKIVREAHGSNIESARSNIMTSPSEAVKMFTTLYGFMNNSYGQIADSVNKIQTKGIGNEVVLARTFMALIVPGFWAHYLTHGTPQDEDKNAKGWATWVAESIAGEMAGTLPMVRDAVSMVEGFSHAGQVGPESWMSTMVTAGKDIVKIAQGKEVNRPIADIADAVGMGLHIPGLGQLGKTAQYLSDVHEGKIHPHDAKEFITEALLGHKKH